MRAISSKFKEKEVEKYSKYGNITDMSMTLTLTSNKFKIEKSRVNVRQKWKS